MTCRTLLPPRHPRPFKSRKLSAAWEAALRLAYTPVIRRFKEALPCLHAPWREAAGEHAGEAADNKDTGAHEELRRKMCP